MAADNYEIDVTLDQIFGTGISSVEQTVESHEPNGVNEITVTLTNGQTSVFNVRNGDSSGKPTPVATVAEMTDTSEIYLYTGNEEGYVKGNIYCYEGGEWTDVGTYGGMVVDEALDADSENAVTNKAITSAIQTLNNKVNSKPDIANGGNKTIIIGEVDQDPPSGVYVPTVGLTGALSSLNTTNKNSLTGAINEVKADVNALIAAVGSPLVANTAAGMTDQTKIYVYTGSETGYTSGHWYYYDGSAWADGGIYQSTGIDTDKTLTVANQAADGKAVGDELSALKSALDEAIEDFAVPTQEAVDNWLDAHPEATTTVQDGSITVDKLTNKTKHEVINDYISLKYFGAVGDGLTDDSNHITEAINYCISNNCALYVPGGTYLDGLSRTLPNGFKMFGDGKNVSILKFTGTGTYLNVESTFLIPAIIKSIDIVNGGNADNSGILVSKIENNANKWGICIQCDGVRLLNFGGFGIKIVDGFSCYFNNCYIIMNTSSTKLSGTAVMVTIDDGHTAFPNQNVFYNCYIGNAWIGVQCISAVSLLFDNCTVETVGALINVERVTYENNIKFKDCWLEAIQWDFTNDTYVSRETIINAKINEQTLEIIDPVANKENIRNIIFKNCKGARVSTPYYYSSLAPVPQGKNLTFNFVDGFQLTDVVLTGEIAPDDNVTLHTNTFVEKYGNIVNLHLRFTVSADLTTAGATLVTLPVGYSPSKNIEMIATNITTKESFPVILTNNKKITIFTGTEYHPNNTYVINQTWFT